MGQPRNVVTSLRERRGGRVAVELDGVPWRTLPADTIARAGLAVGRVLDRETARTLARELRRARALGDALQALRHGDLSRRRLDERLERRGIRADARAEALETLERAGFVDDRRIAGLRAATLADRGYGDAAIRVALERAGLAGELVFEALAGLEPEADRARRVLDRRGAGTRTLRWLAARGFEPGTLEDVSGFAGER